MQENNGKDQNEEKIIDIKGTFEDFIEAEKPEISQEEAIKAYKEEKQYSKVKNKNNSSSEDEENEDDEHLKRVKKALLESLKRVDIMEKKIFDEKDNIKDLKEKNQVKVESQKNKEKEDVLEQMKQKNKNDEEKERS